MDIILHRSKDYQQRCYLKIIESSKTLYCNFFQFPSGQVFVNKYFLKIRNFIVIVVVMFEGAVRISINNKHIYHLTTQIR